jgi:hypothetical protein
MIEKLKQVAVIVTVDNSNFLIRVYYNHTNEVKRIAWLLYYYCDKEALCYKAKEFAISKILELNLLDIADLVDFSDAKHPSCTDFLVKLVKLEQQINDTLIEMYDIKLDKF